MTLSMYVAGVVALGRVPQWLVDAMWVEPHDPMCAVGDD
jgi:hypothetical protein